MDRIRIYLFFLLFISLSLAAAYYSVPIIDERTGIRTIEYPFFSEYGVSTYGGLMLAFMLGMFTLVVVLTSLTARQIEKKVGLFIRGVMPGETKEG